MAGGYTTSMPNMDNFEGRAKESAGALTGGDELKREGKADQAAGTMKDKANKMADKMKGIFKKR